MLLVVAFLDEPDALPEEMNAKNLNTLAVPLREVLHAGLEDVKAGLFSLFDRLLFCCLLMVELVVLYK